MFYMILNLISFKFNKTCNMIPLWEVTTGNLTFYHDSLLFIFITVNHILKQTSESQLLSSISLQYTTTLAVCLRQQQLCSGHVRMQSLIELKQSHDINSEGCTSQAKFQVCGSQGSLQDEHISKALQRIQKTKIIVNRQNDVKTPVWFLNSSLTNLVIMAVVEVIVSNPQLCSTFSPKNWIIFAVRRRKTPLGFKKAQTSVVTRVKYAQ